MKIRLAVLFLSLLAVTAVSAQAAPAGFTKIASTAAGVVTYSDASCADQTTCYYFVTAVDPVTGHESPGAPCSTSALCFGGNQAVAVMPSSGTHTVAVTWTASTTVGVTYNVYRAVGPLAASGLSATVN